MIFIVEDEPTLRRSFVEYLQTKGHDAAGFEDAESALAAVRQSAPDVVISDLGLPRMGGLELLREVAQHDPGVVRIAITAHGTVRTAIQAMRDGCYEYLEKPCDLQRLERIVDRALDARRQGRELAWLRDQQGASSSTILGDSEAIRTLRAHLSSVASLPGVLPPIFLSGETGVGKSLAARELHALRPTKNAPWIEVNCAALPATLVEAELFGHERAAFTDARQARPGLFEAATGGTLFLDEVGELALEAQAKLLRVVESGTVRRLGSVSERKVEVTLITASNVDLHAAVQASTFREDLYHRLAALPIHVPPLRDRGDDAVLLARSFVHELSARYKKPLTLSPAAEERIRTLRWPGNVRELRFAVERAVILAPPGRTALEPADLPHDAAGPAAPMSTAPPVALPRTTSGASIAAAGGAIHVELPPDGIAFEALEKAILKAALDRVGGNVVRAARLLQLTRDTVRYRMKKLGLGDDSSEGDKGTD